jgi:hypothetical protein
MESGESKCADLREQERVWICVALVSWILAVFIPSKDLYGIPWKVFSYSCGKVLVLNRLAHRPREIVKSDLMRSAVAAVVAAVVYLLWGGGSLGFWSEGLFFFAFGVLIAFRNSGEEAD